MKKKYILTIFLVVLLFIIFILPKKINYSYEGIKFSLQNPKYEESVEISIKGYYYKNLFIDDYFQGTIALDNKSYPGLKLYIGNQFQMISYRDFSKDGKIDTYGEIFIGEDFKTLTICVVNPDSGWSSTKGVLVSAPAKNRNEAINISNKLMEFFLKHKLQ